MSWTPANTEEEQEVKVSSDNTGVLTPYWLVANCSSYLSAKGKLGQLLHGKGVKWFSSGLHLHPAQHHDDGGHNQSQETTDIDDDVGVFGFHGVHRVCCFLFCRNKHVEVSSKHHDHKVFKPVLQQMHLVVGSLPEMTLSQAD